MNEPKIRELTEEEAAEFEKKLKPEMKASADG